MENYSKFDEMLDMLMDEYPSLEKEAMALKDRMAAEHEKGMGAEEDMMEMEEEPVMPGAFKEVPPELEDEEVEEEGEEDDEEEMMY